MVKKKQIILDAAVSALATAVARQFLGSFHFSLFLHGLQGKRAIQSSSVQSFLHL